MSYAPRPRIPVMATIDVGDDAQVAHWAEMLDVGEGEILRAVQAVGPFAAAVRDYLKQEE
jgi:hypothetical protein